MATGMISNPANEMVRHQLTKEEEEYMEALRKGARVKYGGAYLAVAFLQAIQFEKTVNQVFSPLAKVGNGLLHTSLDKFLQELLSLRGKDISFGKIDSRFDVILGRRAPAPKSMFGRRKSEKNNPMLLQLVLPTELQSNNQVARELSKTMRNSAEQALSWMLDTLPKNDRSVLGNPKMLKRVLRKQAYIQLIDGVLHVRLILLKQKATRKFAEALCGALNAKNPHTLGRLKFPLRIAVGSSSPWY